MCAPLHLNAIQIRLLHPDVDCRHFSVTKCISACVYVFVSLCVCLCLLVHDRIVMHTSCVFVAVCVCVCVRLYYVFTVYIAIEFVVNL